MNCPPWGFSFMDAKQRPTNIRSDLEISGSNLDRSNHPETWAQVAGHADLNADSKDWPLDSRMLILKIPDLRAQSLPLQGYSGLVLHLFDARPHQRNTHGASYLQAVDTMYAVEEHPHSVTVGCSLANNGTESPTCGKQALLEDLESDFVPALFLSRM